MVPRDTLPFERLAQGVLRLSALLIACLPLLVADGGYAGSKACARCHPSIFRKYSSTPMANASGDINATPTSAVLPGEFSHSLSGVRYRVFRESREYYFEFDKRALPPFDRDIRGRKRLDYFIGSGAHARGYLFRADGFLFQVPISYYTTRGAWDMAPGYDTSRNIFLGRLIGEECLECHASRVQAIRGAPGRYESVAFLEGAVGCERCHGPGKSHISQMTGGGHDTSRHIVNPAKLEPRRRDSVCAQCHLSGAARIRKPASSLATFRPGDTLSDHVVSFVWSSAQPREMKVIGHYEALWYSRCKRVSGDRLWCGTCHDPHSVPNSGERVEFFRRKCLACHQESSCTLNRQTRREKGDGCADCHMPTRVAVDGVHTAFTDHSIPRRSESKPNFQSPTARATLVPFWNESADIRDLALAYGKIAASTQKSEDYFWAIPALEEAAKRPEADAEVLSELAYIRARQGDTNAALVLYEQALRADPDYAVACVNLGNYLAQRGDVSRAMQLWRHALSIDPGLEAPGINLSQIYVRNAQATQARRYLSKVLEFNPDSPLAWKLWSTLPQ